MRKVIDNILKFISDNKWILLIILLLFLERCAALFELNVTYNLKSDDLSYINSGIYFANTGVITMHDTNPSAQIMPGMTVLIGLFSLVLGEGTLLWIALKLLWIVMGCLTAFFIYKSVSLFAPKWCGIIATIPLFRPDIAWMDNIILTETPFMMLLTAMIYFTLKMGKENNYKNFLCCAISYMLALMLKANIAPYPVFALIYLLIVKYNKKLLLKQIVILAMMVLCFVIPWSIRNYIHFDTFVPLTYGSGNPTLLGTYQGIDYPSDESLDYVTNVDEVVKQKYSKYYDSDGEVLPQYKKYVYLQADGIKAKYRQEVWKETEFDSMLYSYFVIKPRDMINSIFYWDEIFNIKSELLTQLPYLEILICIFTAVASLILKKYRAQIFFVLFVYLGNIYIYSMTYSFSRYNASMVSLKFIVLGFGAFLAVKLLKKAIQSVDKEEIKDNKTEELL